MPEMTLLGWFHTIFGVFALVTAIYTLRHYKVISMEHLPGRLYVYTTIFVAGSSLAIYNQGGFGIAHWLGVLTLVAVFGGLADGKVRVYLVAFQSTSKPWVIHQHAAVSI